MTEFVFRSGRWALNQASLRWPGNAWRIALFVTLMALISSTPELRAITFSAIADAYLAVTVFVAGTLALVYLFENTFGFDLGRVMSRAKNWQAPLASLLGALPGCGGAIIVMTQYTKGQVSFGGVVAVLIATMGDAAFLLIAREPMTGLLIMGVGLVIGTLSGWFVDAIHGTNFLRAEVTTASKFAAADAEDKFKNEPYFKDIEKLASRGISFSQALSKFWIWLIVPAGVLGVLGAFLVDTDALLFGPLASYGPTEIIGVIGGLLCVTMWCFSSPTTANFESRGELSTSERIIKDTNFVTTFVVVGFLAYELATHFAGTGIENWLMVWAPFVPLVAIVVGFIPGCGPQIVVTTLYLSGSIPLSAQLGNAIANDGDALFPAIALAPRAAILATIYSAVPAFFVAYGYYFYFEM